MNIFCLGWGSLINSPGCLNTLGEWSNNGPKIKIELLRHSSKNRFTLILDELGTINNSFYIKLASKDLENAINNLAMREGLVGKHWRNNIGVFPNDYPDSEFKTEFDEWVKLLGADFVIWTNLKSNIDGTTIEDKWNNIVSLLEKPKSDFIVPTKDYLSNIPSSIDTILIQRLKNANFI